MTVTKKHRQFSMAVAGLASLALLATACGANSTTGGKPGGNTEIVIGQLLPRTGGLADLGTRVGRGAEIARLLANDAGGINGHQIKWESVDAPDDNSARKGAERLVSGGVKIVYGTYGSSLALAAAPVVVRAGGIYWEEGASTDELTSHGWDGAFRVAGTAGKLGVDAVNYAAKVIAPKLGVKPSELTVGWAGVENSYGQDVLAGVKKTAAENGMRLVLSASYPLDSTDLSTVARQAQKAHPDVLVLTNYTTDAAALGRALRAANFEAKAIIGTGGGHADPSWVEAMGTSGNGFFNLGTVPKINSTGLLPQARDRADAFATRYKQVYGQEPAGFDRMGFDGAWVLFEVLKKAGSTEPAAVKKAAMSLDLPERSLLSGDGVHFADNGQNERVAWFTSQWQDGKLVPVAPEDLALGKPTMIPLPPLG